ncbi:MAG: hypothetical protein R2909_00185 [Gemmatimonadales bacterium]
MVTPSTVTLNAGQLSAGIMVSSTPAGSQVAWQVTERPAWATVSPSSGTAQSTPTSVTVTASIADTLSPGVQTGAVVVTSNGGTATVTAQLAVDPNPIPTPSVATVAFGPEDAEATFTITNTGNVAFSWTLTPSVPWLRLDPVNGTIGRGQTASVTARIDRPVLAAGNHAAAIEIGYAFTKIRQLPVLVEVAAAPKIATSARRLVFPAPVSSIDFQLGNPGFGPLTWTAQPSVGWVQVTPSAGQIPAGGHATVTIGVDHGVRPPSENGAQVSIASNAPASPLLIEVFAHDYHPLADGEFRTVAHPIVDAEYDRLGDRILAVSSDRMMLVMDPSIPGEGTFTLPAVPTSISVEPEGRYAAVGHDGFVSLVDIPGRWVLRTVPVSADVLDVVLAPTMWAYVLPRRDQWVQIRNVNLATGLEVLSTAHPPVYAGSLGRLHPSGRFLYVANNGLSPSDVDKYDVRFGVAERLYDSRYHGEFPFAGDLWFTQGGDRFYARSGNVFRVSEDPATDIVYGGSLSGIGGIRSAVHSEVTDRVYVLPMGGFGQPDPAELRVYGGPFNNYLGSVAIPQATVLGVTYDLAPRFVFVSRDGSRVYIVARGDQVAGPAVVWGYLLFRTSQLP